MKRTALVLIILLLSGGTNVFAQRLTISQKEAPLSKVFSIIQQQTGYSLLYDNQLLKQAKNINIDMKDATIEEVLNYCLKDLPLTYVIIGKIIVIKEKSEPEQKPIVGPQNIGGIIKDENSNSVSGASVVLKELQLGTQSDEDGSFSFTNIQPGTYTIEISFIGFNTERQTVNVNAEPLHLFFKLKMVQVGMQEITVATALGITKKSRALTYSTQTIRNNDISTVKNTNLLNSLNGKVAGIQINRTSGGAGGSVRVVLRGDKSTRSSQPLYVIDGMPIINPSGGPTAGLYNGNPDGGDILSSINPDDIESINVLKGASASALYGSLGSNGVILITTKKGREEQSKINFSSSICFDRASILPQLQFSYAQSTLQTPTNPGSEDSWGERNASNTDKNYIKDFFQTGVTFINGINFSSGNDLSSNYFSYSNTDNKGILPGSSFTQHTLSLHQDAKLLQNKLVLDGTVLGAIQTIKNRATPGVYYNPLTGLYLLPRGLNFNNYSDYEYFSPSRYLNAQNWWNINYDKDLVNGGWLGQDYQQNPYWVLQRNAIENRNQNIYASALMKYMFTSSFSIQARGNINQFISENLRKIYATSQPTISYFNGRYVQSKSTNTTIYGDLLLTYSKSINDNFAVDVSSGAAIQQQKGKTLYIEGQPTVPNVFLESALGRNTINVQNDAVAKQIQSVFINAQLSYKNKVFFDFSDRNDWSSTLAFTPTEKKGYNYYSIGTAAILNEMFRLPQCINLAKLRIAYAIVGNDIAPFTTYPLYTFFSGTPNPPPNSPLNLPGHFLKPEKNKSLETGMQWSLFNNRLIMDIAWYKSNITNQYFQRIAVPPGLGTGGFADINAGNIQNTGLELVLSYKIIDDNNFTWNNTLNFSHNKNRIKELFNTDVVSNTSPDQLYRLFGSNGDFGILKKGGSYNDIYGRAFIRDAHGNIVVSSATGIPFFTDEKFLANPNPTFIAGLKNSFNWKKISFQFLIDGKFGGKVISITEAYADQMGVSERTGKVRDNGGTVFIANAVDENGNSWKGAIDAKEYYKKIGGKTPVGEAYMFDATAMRMREFSIAYNVPSKIKAVRELKLGIIGSNLFFLYRKAPFDPEQVAGVNPGGVGVDVFGLPNYRSIGFTLNASF